MDRIKSEATKRLIRDLRICCTPERRSGRVCCTPERCSGIKSYPKQRTGLPPHCRHDSIPSAAVFRQSIFELQIRPVVKDPGRKALFIA